MEYFVYWIRCRDDSIYTGFTHDVQVRFAKHQAGKGARYTRARRPLTLVAAVGFASAREARSAEVFVKRFQTPLKRELCAFQW